MNQYHIIISGIGISTGFYSLKSSFQAVSEGLGGVLGTDTLTDRISGAFSKFLVTPSALKQLFLGSDQWKDRAARFSKCSDKVAKACILGFVAYLAFKEFSISTFSRIPTDIGNVLDPNLNSYRNQYFELKNPLAPYLDTKQILTCFNSTTQSEETRSLFQRCENEKVIAGLGFKEIFEGAKVKDPKTEAEFFKKRCLELYSIMISMLFKTGKLTKLIGLDTKSADSKVSGFIDSSIRLSSGDASQIQVSTSEAQESQRTTSIQLATEHMFDAISSLLHRFRYAAENNAAYHAKQLTQSFGPLEITWHEICSPLAEFITFLRSKCENTCKKFIHRLETIFDANECQNYQNAVEKHEEALSELGFLEALHHSGPQTLNCANKFQDLIKNVQKQLVKQNEA